MERLATGRCNPILKFHFPSLNPPPCPPLLILKHCLHYSWNRTYIMVEMKYAWATPSKKRMKDAIVLYCLFVLGFRINEWFLRRAEMKTHCWWGDRCTRWNTEIDMELKDGGRKDNEPKTKWEKKEGNRSSNRRSLFWGLSIEAISADWLCRCVTQSWSLETLCVFVGGGSGPQLLSELGATHLFGHTPAIRYEAIVTTRERLDFGCMFFTAPPCSQFMITFV